MNNGITIIGESIAPLGSKNYDVKNPQIVNGCQTVHCLYCAYSENNKNRLSDNLKVFVKIIQTNNPESQSDIISATNSQNPVKSASLKANDNIQKNIESYLIKEGIYYERRENYYKRQGYTGNKVIGLLKMAQIMHTVVNKESIVALNDTATLFDTVAKYKTIFNDKADYDIYVFSTLLYQKIWTLKNSDLRTNEYAIEQKDLISKGGFVFLHILSTLMFSNAQFQQGNELVVEKIIDKIKIENPKRKNEFTKRKKWLFDKLKDENFIEEYYNLSKRIFFEAATQYSKQINKTQNSLFKNRYFDKEFLKPVIEKTVDEMIKL